MRSVIGIKDIEMAEILRCSPATIHSLESGRLKLSETMAVRIAHETGAAVSWLLEGKPTLPVSRSGKPYTRELFERARAKEEDPGDLLYVIVLPVACGSAIKSVLRVASRNRDISLAVYKIKRAVNDLINEFCSPKDIASDKALNFGPPIPDIDIRPVRRKKRSSSNRKRQV